MESWSCSRCTFLNPPSQKSSCQICLSPSTTATSSSSSTPRWSCTACTFSNPFAAPACEICGTIAASSRPLDLDELCSSDAAVGSVFLPLRRCGEKRKSAESSADVVEIAEEEGAETPSSRGNTLKLLSYNVWFREDMEVYKRMEAIGDLIQQCSPDVICLQEVTPDIYRIFQNAPWWKVYRCSHTLEMAVCRPYFCMQMSKLPVKEFRSVPFSNSIMGRELCITEVDTNTSSLLVATSHLESPCPAPPKWDQMYSSERVAQAKLSVKLLEDLPNVIFCGDMNWEDKIDGPFPLPQGWVDAWSELRPGEIGFTFDTKSNQMLSANRTLQRRLDRFVCRLKDFKISSIEMIGKDAIPGVSYVKEKKVKGRMEKLVLPVLPSDHYGLVLTIQRV